MKLAKPSLEVREPSQPDREDEYDFLQRLKFVAYESTLDGLEAKKLMPDRISRGMLQDEIARALEAVLAVDGVTLGITQRRKLIEEIEFEVTGFGPIQPFLDDPTVDDIIVTRPGPRLTEGLLELLSKIHPDVDAGSGG